MFVAQKILKYVTNFMPVIERKLVNQISSKPLLLTILQFYAPTAEITNDEVEASYNSFTEIIKKT